MSENMELANKISELYLLEQNQCFIQREDGNYVNLNRPVTLGDIEDHLSGKITLGFQCTLGLEQKTNRLVLSISLDDDDDDASEMVKRLYDEATTIFDSRNIMLEASTCSYPSCCMTVFLGHTSVVSASRIAQHLLKKADLSAEKVFPRMQTSPTQDDNSFLNLPLGMCQKQGIRSRILSPTTLQPIADESLLKIEAASEETVNRVLDIILNETKEVDSNIKLGNSYLHITNGNIVFLDKKREAFLSHTIRHLSTQNGKIELAERLKLPMEDVERAIAKALLRQRKKDKSSRNQEIISETHSSMLEKELFDGETLRKARELLQDQAFFYKLGKVMEYGLVLSKPKRIRFVVGEERNKRIIPCLIGASAKLTLTSIIRLIGAPGTAKDTIIRNSLELLSPTINSVERGYLTPGGLRYSNEIRNADVLYVPDSPELHGEMARQLRFMRADDGGMILEYAHQNPESGMMTTTVDKLGIKIIVTTSNELRMDPALESGSWTIETDSDPNLTHRVLVEKLKLRANKRPVFPEEEFRVWKAAFHIALTEDVPDKISVPYAGHLIALLSKGSTTQRRSPDKLCDMIETVALFNRFKKTKEKHRESDPRDLYHALQLGLEAILKTVAPIDSKEKSILKAVKELDNNATVRDVSTRAKIAYNTAYKSLERLVDKEYLSHDIERGRKVYSFSKEIADDEKETEEFFVSLEKSPKAIFNLLQLVLNSNGNSPPLLEKNDCISVVDPITGSQVQIRWNGEELEYSEDPPKPEWVNYPFHDNLQTNIDSTKSSTVEGEEGKNPETSNERPDSVE